MKRTHRGFFFRLDSGSYTESIGGGAPGSSTQESARWRCHRIKVEDTDEGREVGVQERRG